MTHPPKRGHLWVDWVELGCRGWQIDQTGAELAWDYGEGCCELDHAHLDRTTLDLAFGGCRTFLCRVVNDLCAAGLVYQPFRGTMSITSLPTWLPLTAGTANTGGSVPTEKWSADTRWSLELDGMGSVHNQQWRHPSGATITIKRLGWFARWWAAIRASQLRAIAGHFYSWFKLANRMEKLRKAA